MHPTGLCASAAWLRSLHRRDRPHLHRPTGSARHTDPASLPNAACGSVSSGRRAAEYLHLPSEGRCGHSAAAAVRSSYWQVATDCCNRPSQLLATSLVERMSAALTDWLIAVQLLRSLQGPPNFQPVVPVHVLRTFVAAARPAGSARRPRGPQHTMCPVNPLASRAPSLESTSRYEESGARLAHTGGPVVSLVASTTCPAGHSTHPTPAREWWISDAVHASHPYLSCNFAQDLDHLIQQLRCAAK